VAAFFLFLVSACIPKQEVLASEQAFRMPKPQSYIDIIAPLL
jgi:hypothetical protein